jgi:hypothetical protein
MTERIRVDKALYRCALLDAIDYTTSFLGGHSPAYDGGPSCCKRGERCDGYKQAAELLTRYRRALQSAGGAPVEPEGRAVLLTEVAHNWPTEED